MIIVVDDEEGVVELSQASLEKAGFAVRSFTVPTEALAFLENCTPDLIISDLMMPEMDGFVFRETYLRNFPERSTPFLFLSSVSDPDSIVEGLKRGADDFLVKPVDYRVFTAKIQALLRRKAAPEHVFHGDLARFPLSKVMKFCELKGITGSVTIIGDGVSTTFACRVGNFELDGQADYSQFENAFDLSAGSFTISIQPVDYSELRDVQSAPLQNSIESQGQDLPMGKLSGVKIKQRTFQVQSEFVEKPHQQVLTMVVLDGRVVLKRGTPALLSLGRVALQQLIEEQHISVEQEIREKITSRIEAKSNIEVSQKERFNVLFEEGWEFYCKKDYAKALALWEEAQGINPTDKTIETNLKIVRNKLAS